MFGLSRHQQRLHKWWGQSFHLRSERYVVFYCGSWEQQLLRKPPRSYWQFWNKCLGEKWSGDCEDPLGPLPTDGSVTIGSNEGAPLLEPQCGTNIFGAGVWFNFVGTGERVVVSTCHEATVFPAITSSYISGDGSCDTLSSCVTLDTASQNRCENSGGVSIYSTTNQGQGLLPNCGW
jgi:hypothetical protein